MIRVRRIETSKVSVLVYQLLIQIIDNTINIKAWRNDNPRDHVLKDCLAILK